jgi:hypothetical protein
MTGFSLVHLDHHAGTVMWHWILCYLAGQHEFAMICEREAIFLRCRSCGRRSTGWELSAREPQPQPAPARSRRIAALPLPSVIGRLR